MVELKNSDIRLIDKAFQSDPGYCLNFSDRTFAEFFQDEFGVDIDADEFRRNGTSKMNRLRTFLRVSDSAVVARVIRGLAEYRESIAGPYELLTKKNLERLIDRIESGSRFASVDALERFTSDQTLEDLIGSIERDIKADKPAVALDRLHTYCSKKFGHLLDKRGVSWSRDEPLHSRVGKYVKALNDERRLQDMTLQILKNSIGVFDKFNHVRNNKTLAHDNGLLHDGEARFIFDSISALLRFVKVVDTERFDE